MFLNFIKHQSIDDLIGGISMKLKKISIENYRLLNSFHLDLETELSIIVGKNNTGKTSVLQIMNKFLNSKEFSYNDFSNSLRKNLYSLAQDGTTADELKLYGISMSLFIEYGNGDNLSNIRHLMQDLDPENNTVILNYRYELDNHNARPLKEDYETFLKEKNWSDEKSNFEKFIKKTYKKYFKKNVYSILYDIKKRSQL